MAHLDLPDRIGGKYRPLRLLGKGGMGAVYEVEHEHTGQHFAMKILAQRAKSSVERFRREARAASLIQSEHIVRVTDADLAPELGGAPYIVMELLEGQDLEAATGNTPQPPVTVVAWLRQVARALVKAHLAGLVHRDLKPENVFLTRREDGTPLLKLLDFGIAKMASEASALTASDAFLGTPGYMAPEQTDSRGPPVTFRADLYAMGLLAFKLLTGRIYWKSGSLAQLLAQLLADAMPPASERGSTFGPRFDAWFARACDRDASKRFASATEQVEALADALGLPSEAPRPTLPPSLPSAPPILEPRGHGSLNASVSDLTTARRKTARRRVLGGAMVGFVVTVAAAIGLLRGAARSRPTDAAASAEAASPRANGAPGTMTTSTLAPDPPSLRPSLPPSSSGGAAPGSVLGPVKHPSIVPTATKRHNEPSDASAPGAATLDASRVRDPLEGPW